MSKVSFFMTTALDNSKIFPIYSGIIASLAHSQTSFCTSNNADVEEGHSTQFRPVNKALLMKSKMRRKRGPMKKEAFDTV